MAGQPHASMHRREAATRLMLVFALVPVSAVVLSPLGRAAGHGVVRWILALAAMAGPALLAPALGWLTWSDAGLCLYPRKGAPGAIPVIMAAAAASLMLALSGQWFAAALSGRVVLGITSSFAWTSVLAALPGSAGEEILFRGTLQGLANKALPGHFAIRGARLRYGTMAVALAFGLVHLVAGGGVPTWTTLRYWQIAQTLFGTLHGTVFGCVRDELGPVWIPAALHVFINVQLVTLAVA